MVNLIEVYILELLLVLVLSNGILKRKCQVKLLNEIIEIEEIFLELKSPLNSKNYEKINKVHFIRRSIWMYYLIDYIIKCSMFWGQTTYLTSLLYFAFWENVMNAFIIFLLVLVIMQAEVFTIINLNIKNLLESADSCNMSELRKLLTLQDRLFRTIKMFNDAFGMTIAPITLYLVVTQTCELYLGPFVMLTLPLDSIDAMWYYDGLTSAMWIIPFFAAYAALAISCNKTLEEAKSLKRNCKHFDVPGVNPNLKEMVSHLP